MPESWNAETYRARAARSLREAGNHPEGKERDACLAIADGYSRLAALIDRDAGSGATYSNRTGRRDEGQGG